MLQWIGQRARLSARVLLIAGLLAGGSLTLESCASGKKRKRYQKAPKPGKPMPCPVKDC